MKRFKKIVVIDNFDSFTYNLVDYFKRLEVSVVVFRNTISLELLDVENFDLLVLSPGPSVPKNAGNLMAIIEHFYESKPIFGVCLGHQALVEFFGGTLKFLEPKHGKPEIISHDGQSIYKGLPEQVQVARYHSLAADSVPNVLQVSAKSSDGVVMSVRHKILPIEGVQFHPESVLSMKDEVGFKMIQNLVEGRISTGSSDYYQLMQILQDKQHLTKEDMGLFLTTIMEEQLNEDQKLILLVSLSFRLKKPYFLHQFIKELQKYALIQPNAATGESAIDICGTGGSGLPRINTSTLSALLLSGLNVPIIKHGNKAASGRFGSFDLLEQLGVEINATVSELEHVLLETQLSFLYAPKLHPVVGHFAGSRAKMGIPTIFNVLGPLLNPYQPKRQFIGTAFEQYMELILETAILMGKEHVIVVRGEEGLDEISVSKPSRVLEYKDGQRSDYIIYPEQFGINAVPFEDLSAHSPQENVSLAQAIINGHTNSAHYKLVLANAAFVYSKFHTAIPLEQAYKLMEEKMKAGVMNNQLKHYNSSLINFKQTVLK